MTKIFDSVVDTRSILLNDQQIAGIPDAFYGNKYTVRVFENYEDLYPVFTLDDVLPKRPQLNSEMKPANYPSLDVNLDKLVSALQSPESVTANWSLPKDSRGLYLDSHRIGFQRKNCIDASKWPKCSKRSEQFNEFFFSSQFVPSGVTTASPTPVAPRVGKTVLSGMRLFVLDKSHRPMEVSILMNYAL